jgi:hypothetical protein
MKVIKRYWYCLFVLLSINSGCKIEKRLSDDVNLMVEWNNVALDIETFTEGVAVPISARFFGYYGFIPLAIDAYQKDDFTFINKTFPSLKLPDYKINHIDRCTALNIAYFEFASKYYVNIHYKSKEKCADVFDKWEKKINHNKNKVYIENSKLLGLLIARELLNWSNKDSLASQAHLHNFDRNYIPKNEKGKWKIDEEHPMPPQLPYWGNVRPLLFKYEDFKCNPPKKYDENRTSPYYLEALELFTISSPLSFENKWIAEFWGDDVRGLTFTPAGRWISILGQLIQQSEASFDTAVEAYFKVGLGLCDSGIITWKYKYLYDVERPHSYIRKNIHDAWRPFHPSPNFPGYPSGHSVLGGVSAEILTNIFGDNIEFKDNSHQGRKEFLSEPRSYKSIRDMAIESAYSRIPLGVHFRMDCTEGLRLGTEIGKAINNLEIHTGKEVFKN